jgi:hypothetical protein
MKNALLGSVWNPLSAGAPERDAGPHPSPAAGHPLSTGPLPMKSSRSVVFARGLAWLAALGLSACSSGGGGSSAGTPGEMLTKPDGSPYFVDQNQGGNATRVHLAEMYWARLVDVHDVDAQGRANQVPVFRDFAINENVQSDGSNYVLETNPITQKTRLIILRERTAPDAGFGDFDFLLRSAKEGLSPIIPKHDDGSTGDQYSFVARNAALVLRFDDLLDDDAVALQDLVETVRINAGYPPITPFPARRIFDPNHGAVVADEFHSTRILVDLTISESEAASMVVPQPVNAVGLPASLVTTTTNPNVSVRIPTQTDFGSGQFQLLRNLSGAPLHQQENGPVDRSSPTRDVVRAMRSGNGGDQNNGFLLDLNSPSIVGGWNVRVDQALPDPDPLAQPGFDFVVDVTFTTVCLAAPQRGDVISIGEVFFEVAADGPPPDVDGEVLELRVRNLGDQPIGGGTSILGNALFLSTFSPVVSVPAGCWISFEPQPVTLPATGVQTDSQVLVRFSEPMDPSSISPFDNFFVVRGDSNTVVIPTNLIVGEALPSSDLKEFTFAPLLELPHDTNTSEIYHVRVSGTTDLAGNTLANTLPAINFTMDPTQPAVENGGTVLRMSSTDELEPIGLLDLRGQFFLDIDRGLIRPRAVALTSYPADRINPVPSIMIPFASGIQTPLTPLGSKLHAIWRYCDLGWQVLDETKFNLDVYGLAWAPVGGSVINDFFEGFEIRLAHSRRQPDEAIDGNLLPRYTGSGLVGNNTEFTQNILIDPLSPQKTVHPRTLGYQINAANLFLSTSGTIMMPFPLNRAGVAPVTYTWRDTAVLARGAPSATGIPLDIESANPLFLEDNHGYVAGTNDVPSFGLPLLIEYRCYPSDTGLGLNALDISLAINSSAIPSFRSFSSGGINDSGATVARDPDNELTPRGGFNPGSTPPGQRTNRPDDNAFYIGQLDVVTRLSRVHTVWLNSSLSDPDYRDPIVLPLPAAQPLGTQVVIEYRGADGFDIDPASTAEDEATFPFDSRHLDAYGNIFAVIAGIHYRLGAAELPGSIDYVNGTGTAWVADIDAVDGAQYVQMRITFSSNIESGLNPELSAIGIAYSAQ